MIMKKKIFAAFILGLLLAIALCAAAMASEVCELCGGPITSGYNIVNGDSGFHQYFWQCNNYNCGGGGSGAAESHSFTAWSNPTSTTHQRKCEKCAMTSGESEPCSGGTATCTAGAKCSVCGNVYKAALGHDDSGAAATCANPKVCAREGCGFVLQNTLTHRWSNEGSWSWTGYTAAKLTLACTREGCNETEGVERIRFERHDSRHVYK